LLIYCCNFWFFVCFLLIVSLCNCDNFLKYCHLLCDYAVVSTLALHWYAQIWHQLHSELYSPAYYLHYNLPGFIIFIAVVWVIQEFTTVHALKYVILFIGETLDPHWLYSSYFFCTLSFWDIKLLL
jgi:hypothetical protein